MQDVTFDHRLGQGELWAGWLAALVQVLVDVVVLLLPVRCEEGDQSLTQARHNRQLRNVSNGWCGRQWCTAYWHIRGCS